MSIFGSVRSATRRPKQGELVQARWNDAEIATSQETVVVEGNHYFPRDSVAAGRLAPSDHTTVCPWKGVATYFDVVVDGKVNRAAAWTYEQPSKRAAPIAEHVAFWHGVTVQAVDADPDTAAATPPRA